LIRLKCSRGKRVFVFHIWQTLINYNIYILYIPTPIVANNEIRDWTQQKTTHHPHSLEKRRGPAKCNNIESMPGLHIIQSDSSKNFHPHFSFNNKFIKILIFIIFKYILTSRVYFRFLEIFRYVPYVLWLMVII